MTNNRSFAIGIFMIVSVAPLLGQREVLELDSGWKFLLGEVHETQTLTFDDSGWRTLDVPHDWAFEADYDKNAAQTDSGGYKPGGIGWYRKGFELPASWNTKRVTIDFDAVFMNSQVWINGQSVGERPYGYISFSYDITPHLKTGPNCIAVRVDSSKEPAARWYHGCGIYGHVKLIATHPVHLVYNGIYITTPKITASEAEIRIETEIETGGAQPTVCKLETTLLDPTGTPVATDTQIGQIQSDGSLTVKQTFTIAHPQVWDMESPCLYKAVSRVEVNGRTSDTVTTRFGIRTVRWDTDTGFWLNGKNIKLKGVCDHLECGPVGAAVPDELLRWKIQLLKDMGCNAIRTAHNPQAPLFYDLCDEVGMLVMDEIFDGWMRKAPFDYGQQAFAQWWERDLRDWLRRDRNHPCVFLWSLGNETRGEIAPALVRVCHEVDPTRLTTSGHSGSAYMDVYGVNGNCEKMGFTTEKPDKPFVATEAPHTWQVRGYYRTQTWFRDGYPNPRQAPFPCPNLTDEEIFFYDWSAPGGERNRKQVFNSSYDNAMVRITARKNWELTRDLPWYSGQFRWTGFDYLGEAGYVHGGWPFRAFMGGALDLAGFKKDLFYFYQSQWTQEPMVHILPHWTHPRMTPNTEIPVWVYSNCDTVELFLNGKSLGTDQPGKPWDQMQCDWMVPWQPGKLEALGYRGGKVVARAEQITAGVPVSLQIQTDGHVCPIITVAQMDEHGVLNPYAENRIHYRIEGPVRILSLESGNPVNTENNVGTSSRTAFFGLARAFLKTTGDKGNIEVVVGAICGEKQLFSSNRVRIDVQSVILRGQANKQRLSIYYTLDGSDPDENSTPYTGSFAITPTTTVKAAVYNNQSLLFTMQERFGPDEGIVWGSSNDGKPANNSDD